MLHLRDFLTLGAFFSMLLSPCVSASFTVISWDRLDAAYFLLEASVAAMLAPPVAANVHIRPYRVTAAARVLAPQPAVERFIANGVLGWIAPVKPAEKAVELQHLLAA